MFLRQSGNLLRRFRFVSQTHLHTTATSAATTSLSSNPLPSNTGFLHRNGPEIPRWQKHHWDNSLWILLFGQAAIILGANGNLAFADDVPAEVSTGEDGSTGLTRVEDGSVISNIHTSKWRVFTDKARDFFLEGKFVEAEKLFLSALEEAKEGFGKRDPHVASACNNLAELYRVKMDFGKAKPLYLEAIHILEESYGLDDIRVAASLHNLGQFYIVQRKLEDAHKCYEAVHHLFETRNANLRYIIIHIIERALKIKRRILGQNHTDYANTMYHLGTVKYLQGKEKDSVALIQDSIKILEENGLGESVACLRRLQYLAQVFLKSVRLSEAENVHRKILHITELSKGSNSLETVIAAEGLALTLQASGSLKDTQELLQWCLDVRKSLLKEDHIQISANMFHLARVAMLSSVRLRKVDISEAKGELYKAKSLLENSIRMSRRILENPKQKRNNVQKNGKHKETGKDEHAPLVILLQALGTLGNLEIALQELEDPKENHPPPTEAEDAFYQCIAAFRESGIARSVTDSPEVKAEYLSCMKHLLTLISNKKDDEIQSSKGNKTVQELKDEIKQVEAELSLKA